MKTTYLLLVFGDDGDSVEPSGTSATIDLLLRLSVSPGEARYEEASARVLQRVSGRFAEHPDAWAAAVSAVNRYPPTHVVAETAPSSTGASTPPGAVHIEVTADHIRATGVAKTSEGGDEANISLEIDEGYHVNANPASFDYLIPTMVEFYGVKPTEIAYPRPVRFNPAFATDGLDVYEGRVTISAKFPGGSLAKTDEVQTSLTAQACTDRLCLPPSEIPVSIDRGAR